MNSDQLIPFNKPYIAPNAFDYMKEALNSSIHQGGGPFTKRAARMVSTINGGGEVFLTGSCTQALEMATLLLDLQPGDEVILPSFTFTSAAISLVNFGVKPVFVDVDTKNLNINTSQIRENITSKTKAISLVNYAGVTCNFSEISNIAKQYGLFVIEDNAHGFGAISGNNVLGRFGDVSTISFHATKNIQCGEGGALIVNNAELLDRAHILQEKGTNRHEYLSGVASKYNWVDKGGSFLMSEVSAALLLSQLEEFDKIQSARRRIFDSYYNYFSQNGSRLNINFTSSEGRNAAHIFWFMLRDHSQKLIETMNSRKIQVTFHFQSLHSSKAGLQYGTNIKPLNVSDMASSNLVRLPIWPELQQEDVDRIISEIDSIL